MAKIRTDMKAGIDHLAEKLVPIKLQDPGPPVELSDETVEEVLQVCEHKITRLMSLTTMDENMSRKMLDEDRYEEKLMNQSVARIKLADKEEEADDDEDDFDGPQAADDDEDDFDGH